MAEARTAPATVKRLLGSKGVSVEEVVTGQNGQEFKAYFAVWLGDGHGLQVGDKARFYGQLGVKKTEKDGTTYIDVSLSRAQIVADSLERAPAQDANATTAWETATPGVGWADGERQ